MNESDQSRSDRIFEDPRATSCIGGWTLGDLAHCLEQQSRILATAAGRRDTSASLYRLSMVASRGPTLH